MTPTPLNLPLTGVRLVEASAGTGKTFTIATLYLRLLLEGGRTPAQIPVMTFTRLAAAELAGNLRARLALAVRALEQDHPEKACEGDTGKLEDVRRVIAQALAAGADLSTLRQRAGDAQRDMDLAPVGTIHSFCQRMLTEFGFEAGRSLNAASLLQDESELIEETIADFWRQSGVVDAGNARLLSATWGTPEKLAGEVASPRWTGREVLTNGDACALLLRQMEPLRKALAMASDTEREETRAALAAAFTRKPPAKRTHALETLICWGDEGTATLVPSDETLQALHDLSRGELAGMKTYAGDPQNPLLAAIQNLAEQHDALQIAARAVASDPEAELLLGARNYLLEHLPARKRALDVFGYQDLIQALAQALSDPASDGAGAASIKRLILARYPVALVDEFQDTDPLQWHILRTLYVEGAGDLFMVGDPKQAIYAFRGGDVFAYLDASRSASGETLRLKRNFRSSAGINQAVNALFAREQAFHQAGIVAQPVVADERVAGQALLVDDKPRHALTLWQLPSGVDSKGKPKALGKDAARADIENAVVAEIVRLLGGDTGLRQRDGSERALAAGDIAVLVDAHQRAQSLHAALARAGVAAVTTLRHSVFATEEAGEVLSVLIALTQMGDAAATRAALATLLMGWSARDLARTEDDENAWDHALDRMQTLAGQWRRHGPLPMLHGLIAHAAPRLLALIDGQRRVSNLLQLGELLQAASAVHFGEDDLLDWMRQRIAHADDNDEAQQLRLETDRNAVQILTLHASKGLEFPVVFLPYVGIGKKPAADHPPRAWLHEHERACIAMGPAASPARQQQALEEDLAERIRLVYVGLTRARVACYLPWGYSNEGEHGPLYWLLHRAGRGRALDFDAEGCRRALDELAARAPQAITIAPLPQSTAGGQRLPRHDTRPGKARRFTRVLARDWWTWSFTQLAHGGERTVLADDAPGTADDARPQASADDEGLAGARFGVALHELLQHADFAQWRDGPPAQEDARIETSLRRHGLWRPGTRGAGDIADIATLIGHTLNTPLPCGGRLSDLPQAQRSMEMEFHLGLDGVDLAKLLAALQQYGYQRQRASFGGLRRSLAGLLTGVIDLVFEHAGRFHIVDYKSNRLAGYDQVSLARAVREHDYDLQYVLYTLALHRWLRRVQPDYDYAREIGEAYYLFMRGLSASDTAQGIYRDRPPQALIETLDTLLAPARAAA